MITSMWKDMNEILFGYSSGQFPNVIAIASYIIESATVAIIG